MEFDFADIKPGLVNVLIVFGIVLLTVPLAKVAFNRYPVPGITDLVNAI